MAQYQNPVLRGYYGAQDRAQNADAQEMQTLGQTLGAAGQVMSLQEAFRKRQEDEQTRELFRSSGGDLTKMRDSAFGAGLYKQGLELDKTIREQAKQDLERTKLLGEVDAQKRKAIGEASDAVGAAYQHTYTIEKSLIDRGVPPQMARSQAQATWGTMRQQLLADPVVASQGFAIPEAYDTDQAIGMLHKTKRMKEILEQAHKEATAAETKRSNQARESNTVRGQDLSAQTAREGHGITIRGQNMADARSREANASGRVPAGYRANPDGTLSFIPGGPADPQSAANKAALGNPSEDERKAAGWLAQATNAYNNMAKVISEDTRAAGPGFGEAALSMIPITGETMARAVRPEKRDRFMQAASSFSEAALRAATGAGVNESEARQKIAELTPLYTDGAVTRQQKLDSMQVYLDSLTARAGRAVSSTPLPPRSTMPSVLPKAPMSGDFSKLWNDG